MEKEKIIEYIMNTPNNFNEAVLRGMVGDGLDENQIKKLVKYCKTTPLNTNKAVLYSLLGGSGEAVNSLQNENGVDLTTETEEIIEVGE